jgi:hypothetical protein
MIGYRGLAWWFGVGWVLSVALSVPSGSALWWWMAGIPAALGVAAVVALIGRPLWQALRMLAPR